MKNLNKFICICCILILLTGCQEDEMKPYSNKFYKGTDISEYNPQTPQFSEVALIESEEDDSESSSNETVTGKSAPNDKLQQIGDFKLPALFELKSELIKDNEVPDWLSATRSNKTGTLFVLKSKELMTMETSVPEATALVTEIAAKDINVRTIPLDDLENSYIYAPIELTVDKDIENVLTKADIENGALAVTLRGTFNPIENEVKDTNENSDEEEDNKKPIEYLFEITYLERLWDKIDSQDKDGELGTYTVSKDIITAGSKIEQGALIGKASNYILRQNSYNNVADKGFEYIKVKISCKKQGDIKWKEKSLYDFYASPGEC